MKEEFLKFVSSYDQTDERIKYKIEHTLRVFEMMKQYATLLGFTEEEIIIASEIGLLHDIGRFDQLKIQNSFSDHKGFDHADYACDLLFKENLISRFCIDKNHYPIIEFAIREHNKLIPKKAPNKLIEKMTNLIRDVDKTDILYLVGILGEYDKKGDNSEIKSEVLDCFKNRTTIPKKYIETNNEDIALSFALVFDINHTIFLNPIKKYLEAFYIRVNKNDVFEKIYESIITYINERIDK